MRHIKDIFSHFFQHERILRVLIRIPQRGDSNECTQYTISQYKNENHPKLCQICNYRTCSKGPQNEFETAVVNELSVFELLKFYCTYRINHKVSIHGK